jgi:Domain of unknown function (DUF4041)/T5orf172 domain/Protein of unknown function (DUF2510)
MSMFRQMVLPSGVKIDDPWGRPMANANAGWYPDSNDPAILRRWDGTAWTSHTQAGDVPSPAPSAAWQQPQSVEVPRSVLDKPRGGGLFGGKKALEEENEELRRALEAIGATERERIRSDVERLTAERARVQSELKALQAQVVATTDEAILQEVGIYQYRHPLESAVAYKEELARVEEQYKAMAKAGQAVVGATNWQVNGSQQQGTRMVRDFSKLMLRAYNNEADNAIRTMRPYQLGAAVQRLEKARGTISRLGKTMSIQVTDQYHLLRVGELQLTADYIAKAAEEKEHEREEKARLREEEKARREFEQERARLTKEAAHYASALEAMRANHDEEGVREAEAKLAEIEAAVAGIQQREANTRAGYVYVISNVGAFGERMVKIGMTRRLEPLDRIRELGDASVPFRYDLHAMVFSDDAVGLETRLHQELAGSRVNLVNLRREFFYATPIEVRDLLAQLEGSNLLSFEERPEAVEWHQSENTRRAQAAAS